MKFSPTRLFPHLSGFMLSPSNVFVSKVSDTQADAAYYNSEQDIIETHSHYSLAVHNDLLHIQSRFLRQDCGHKDTIAPWLEFMYRLCACVSEQVGSRTGVVVQSLVDRPASVRISSVKDYSRRVSVGSSYLSIECIGNADICLPWSSLIPSGLSVLRFPAGPSKTELTAFSE